MNKKFLVFLVLVTIIFSYIFNADRFFRNQISAFNNSITSSYLDILVSIQSTVNKYFNQLDYIEQLKTQNDESQKYKLLYNRINLHLSEIEKFEIDKFNQDDYNLTKVKVLSYYRFNDHSKVILDSTLKKRDTINSLITYDGYSAGIVLEKDNQSIAYLNHNRKCNYAVYIGSSNAPGITSGMTKSGLLIVKFIPLWKNVNIDDEIITSGMDNIFPAGVKVAKVVSVKENETTKEVFAIPYAKATKERYFYLGTNEIKE